MIKITIPNNNIEERKYILDIIFNEFLGLGYNLENGSNDWVIELANKKIITIKDTFFNKYQNNLEYLKFENIPDRIEELDIFAASFFMLTRWEEYVNKKRDNHDRFPATESLAYKQGFLDRPIVNEYVEMLKNMLLEFDSNLKFKIHSYQLVLTHDVDHIEKWNTFKKFIRHLAGDLIQRKSFTEFFRSIIYFIKVKTHIVNDPYDTFDYFMDISDKLQVKSYFFFMAKGVTNFDNRYKTNDQKVIKLVNKIKKRNHFIGIHPTYNAYNNFEQLRSEINELEKQFDTSISFGREHYLRFEIPTSWQIWHDNNLSWDSTCGYADKEGFRCGVCYEYSVFNILTRKKLELKEKPLIVMDGSLRAQEKMTVSLMKEKILDLKQKVKKYNGEFVFLWHNSSFNTKEWREYNKVYEEVISKL
ncbi:polysaccharide deacetylase family protein [Aliarcobacter butzleri]|uniref:polysaccharide deacetylase family protein n=1 Tax=Aliarcobacter butzleri TaxID=28197 RepID=UPI003AF5E34B